MTDGDSGWRPQSSEATHIKRSRDGLFGVHSPPPAPALPCRWLITPRANSRPAVLQSRPTGGAVSVEGGASRESKGGGHAWWLSKWSTRNRHVVDRPDPNTASIPDQATTMGLLWAGSATRAGGEYPKSSEEQPSGAFAAAIFRLHRPAHERPIAASESGWLAGRPST